MPSRARRIKAELKQLRAECIDGQSDPVLHRLAYEMECAVRYVTERTVGWPNLVELARTGALLLRRDLASPAPPKEPTPATRHTKEPL